MPRYEPAVNTRNTSDDASAKSGPDGDSALADGHTVGRMSEHFDLAVIGAGIVGLGHAAAARARGLRVVVVERADRLNGATIRNFGHVGTSMQAGQGREYAERAAELYRQYAHRAGFTLLQRGSVVVATADDEMQAIRDSGQGRMLSAAEVADLVPVSGAVGAALLPDDMQVDPREAGPALAAWLAKDGVEFRWSTAALAAETGTLHTTRGEIRAENIVWCVNADLDAVLPEVATRHGVLRCGLDMMLVDGVGLDRPLLTGSSMLRYPAFAGDAADAVRARYAAERTELLELDINQMYTEMPGRGLFVGDTHHIDSTLAPFQDERAFEVLGREAHRLLGAGSLGTGSPGTGSLGVRQRWQGVYAKAPQDFLRETVTDGVHVSAVTTGIGMTTGLGLGEAVIHDIIGAAS